MRQSESSLYNSVRAYPTRIARTKAATPTASHVRPQPAQIPYRDMRIQKRYGDEGCSWQRYPESPTGGNLLIAPQAAMFHMTETCDLQLASSDSSQHQRSASHRIAFFVLSKRASQTTTSSDPSSLFLVNHAPVSSHTSPVCRQAPDSARPTPSVPGPLGGRRTASPERLNSSVGVGADAAGHAADYLASLACPTASLPESGSRKI